MSCASVGPIKLEHGGYGMVVIHTVQVDCHTRLWCVFEMMTAYDQSGVQLRAAMSSAYVEAIMRRLTIFMKPELQMGLDECLSAAGVCVNSIQAKCSTPDDEQMLVNQILAHEG